MTALVSRLFGDLGDWFDTDFPLSTTRMNTFRVEDYVDNGNYVVRAELPGMDPEKDVAISVRQGFLEIHAERREETKDKYHSEFRYGSLHRTVRLPSGVDEKKITARYDKGILEITVPMPKVEESAGYTVPIKKA
ncbi:MAG: Hsp20/alpha crystallin family protein [Micromonosporaceae bacterium]